MRTIPPPVVLVPIPEFFSPSQIAGGEECLLRIVLGSDWETASLGAHPAAEVGRVLHRLLELSARGKIKRQGTLEEDLARTLDELLAKSKARLHLNPDTATYADLLATMSPLHWRKKRRTIIDAATELYRLAPQPPDAMPQRKGRTLSYDTLPNTGEWAEVPIAVAELRLKGRMDIVMKSGGAVTIKDLKTGRIEDAGGELRDDIERQLRLYGLAARYFDPYAVIHLIVDDGTEHVVDFDEGIAHDTEMWLLNLLVRLPSGAGKRADELAMMGEWCAWCPHRHVCPAYRSAAPSFWSEGLPFRLPLDVWGHVRNVASRGDLVDLELEDAAGRRVKVFGVDRRRVGDVEIGALLYFFGLRAQLRRSHGGEWHHPLNFFEVPSDGGLERAWTLEVFRGDSPGWANG